MAQVKAGRALIESLRAQGVDTLFGIISTHMMEVYDALYDHQDAIRFISTRHEHPAALMADGYARVTGKPGVCFTSSGPGAANSMGGIGEAYFGSSPVLTVTSTAEEDLYGRGLGTAHETTDQLGMFTPITQWNTHISHPEEVPDRIYEAFQRFQTRRPRPIEIEIPVDIQGQVAEVEIPQARHFAPPEPDPASVEQAAQLLLSGKRVAVIAGNGVHRSGATQELTRLVEALGIPVFTTTPGKGAIPDDNPLSLGVYARLPNPPPDLEDPIQPFVESLDTILVVGMSPSQSMSKSRGRLSAKLIHVDIDAETIGKVLEPTVAVVGDAKLALTRLHAAVAGKSSQLGAGFATESRDLKRKISDYRRKVMPNQMKTIEAIRSVTARDAIFMGDVAVAVHQGANFFLEVYEPRTYMTSHWGGLGFAFPAAIGAKAGLPRRQVICMTGDGGFQYNIQELATCVQYGLNPVVMVFDDSAWGVLKETQRTKYNGRVIASDLQNPSFAKLAEAYGANGVRVESLKELVPALESALKSDTVTVIEVPTPNGFADFT